MSQVLVVGPNLLHREALAELLAARGLTTAHLGVGDLTGFEERDDRAVLVLGADLQRGDAERLLTWLVERRHVAVGRPRQPAADAALQGLRWVEPRDVDDLLNALQRAQVAGSQRERPALQPPSRLTSRELHVLELLARGAGNEEVAAQLSISAHTVRTHIQNILGKLDVSNRFAAVMTAREAGLLERAGSR